MLSRLLSAHLINSNYVMKNYTVVLLMLLLCGSLSLSAEPTRYSRGGGNHTSVGLRAGWIGAPNGLTVRRVVGNGVAFEFVAGYNHKYARHTELPALKKGNSFAGASFAPFFLMSEGNLGVALTADIGARLNYHHYRYFNSPEYGPKITPEVIGGFGIQVEFSESVELFADLHVKYFNEPHNNYVPGIESGLGLRIVL
ncbi:MAG: hypothetical protein RLZZ519_187 [Bacteroidota bacterium]|jgi:hypothetical protein